MSSYPNTCSEKTAYASYSNAMKVIKNIKKKAKNRQRFRPIRAYRCKVCGAWHVTSYTEEER